MLRKTFIYFYGLINPLTCHSCPVVFISAFSMVSSFFCQASWHVYEHCGVMADGKFC